MAHTLSIYNGVEATTISLAATGSSAGYYLEGYTPIDPPYTVSYNSSLYSDGARPTFSRAGNIVETISIFIIGSSANDALDKLRALKRFVWYARETIQTTNTRQPSYIVFTPHGTSNAAYSVVVNGSCNEPPTFLDTDLNAYVIRNVILTIEREPYWRGTQPAHGTPSSASLVSTTGVTNRYHSTTATGTGDIPGLASLHVVPTSGSFSNIIVSYASARTDPYYNSEPAIQGENLIYGTDSSTAGSPSAAQITFATVTTMATRVYGPLTRAGKYRCFAFIYGQTGSTYNVRLRYNEYDTTGAEYVTNPTVAITGADAYYLYDLGPIVTPISNAAEKNAANTYIYFQAQRVSGSGYLFVDTFYFMPTEYMLIGTNLTVSSSDSASAHYTNIFPWAVTRGVVRYTTTVPYYGGVMSGDLRIPPGSGRLTTLIAGSGWSDPTCTRSIYLNACALYLGARGSG